MLLAAFAAVSGSGSSSATAGQTRILAIPSFERLLATAYDPRGKAAFLDFAKWSFAPADERSHLNGKVCGFLDSRGYSQAMVRTIQLTKSRLGAIALWRKAEDAQAQGEELASRIDHSTKSANPDEAFLQRSAEVDQAWESVTAKRRSDAATEVVAWRTGATVCNLQHAHAKSAETFLDKHGWPKESDFGPRLADALWLIVDHATNDRNLQSRALKSMEPLLATKDVNAQHFATLTDRVSLARDGHQIYGTQLTEGAGGCLAPDRLADTNQVDKLRSVLGLVPLVEATVATAAKYARAACTVSLQTAGQNQ